jgi:cytochrome c biogenesis protein CcmG, thiol:disulfide interchange protein DsbE
MKQVLLFSLSLILAVAVSAQNKIPSVKLKDLDGNTVDTGKLTNNGKPIVISFWATWCSPCKKELNAYQELYDQWQKETGVKIIAVTIDDQRSQNRVAPHVNSAGWDFEVLFDPNRDFARAMQVNNVPHTFLINGSGAIVWQHNNYADGDEDELYKELKKLSARK